MAKHRTRIGPIHDFRRARAAYGDGMFAFTQPVNTNRAYGDGMFAFTMPVNTDRAYGDGMFAFTMPVNTDRAYGDGGMFYTQPVGMGNVGPAPIRAGTFQHAGYGAALQPLRVKPSVKATAAAATATEEEKRAARQAGRASRQSSRGQTETKVKAATASPEVVARFEDAARKYGETLFWKNFWSRPSALAGSKFTTSSATLKAADEQKFSAAKAALNAARVELLQGVPAFAAGGTGGLPTDRAGRALMSYEQLLTNDGFYKVAFRNYTGTKRKPSKAVYDAIKRDALDLYVKDSLSKDLAKNIVRAYILADMESSWDADNAEWGITTRPNIPRSKKAENVTYTDPRTGRPVTVRLSYKTANTYNATQYYYLPPAESSHYAEWLNWDKANSKAEAVRAAAMSGDFKNQLKADRTVQEAAKTALPSRFATSKTEWEAARAEHVRKAVTEQRATLQQEQAGRDTESRAVQAENLLPAVRDAGALALSKRAGAEAAALVGDVALTTTSSNEATAAANTAQSGAARIITLANAAAGFAAASAGTGAAANDRAKAARESAEQLAADALTNAEAAFGQIAAAQAKADAMKAEADAEAARKAASDAEIAAADAQARLARGEITQAEYDALVTRQQAIQNEADRLGQVADQKKAEADSVLAAVTPEGAITVSEEATVAPSEGFFSKYKTELAIAALVGGVGVALWWRSRHGSK